jgi:K+-sensing histidine kinase KdpD
LAKATISTMLPVFLDTGAPMSALAAKLKASPAFTLKMISLRWVLPVSASVGVVAVTTAFLLEVQLTPEPQHLIFVYLIPTALVAIRYGSGLAMLSSIGSGLTAAYFFYPPKFSIYIANPLHVAELIFFFILALAASQIVSRLAQDMTIEKRSAGISGAR